MRTQSTEPSAENTGKIAHELKVFVEYLINGEKAAYKFKKSNTSREAQEIIRWVGSLNNEQCRAIIKLMQSFKK